MRPEEELQEEEMAASRGETCTQLHHFPLLTRNKYLVDVSAPGTTTTGAQEENTILILMK